MSQSKATDRRYLQPSRTQKGRTRSTLRRAVEWGALSNIGHVRQTNQDCFFVGRFDRTLEPVLTNVQSAAGDGWHHEVGYVAIVADGMGGHAAGDVASRTAVKTLLDLALDTPDWIMRYDDESLVEEVSRRIERRVRRVDELLESMGRDEPTLAGLGTTVTILALLSPHALIAHVGDSRAYVLHGGALTQITRNHTVAQSLADARLIAPSDVPFHPKRHLLTRAAGHGHGALALDVHRVPVDPGDQVLLCTDGLTDMLADEVIERVLTTSSSAAIACQTLVDLALEKGGRDNITVVVGRTSG